MTYRLTLAQPQFDFKDYPNDEQDLIVRFSIPSYDMEEIQLRPVGIGCSALEDGSCAFSHNPIWTWDEDKKYCTVSSLISMNSTITSMFIDRPMWMNSNQRFLYGHHMHIIRSLYNVKEAV